MQEQLVYFYSFCFSLCSYFIQHTGWSRVGPNPTPKIKDKNKTTSKRGFELGTVGQPGTSTDMIGMI